MPCAQRGATPLAQDHDSPRPSASPRCFQATVSPWSASARRLVLPPATGQILPAGAVRARDLALTEEALLILVVLPLWWAAGALDWALHRRSGIAQNAGARESAFHLAMLAEGAVAVLALLYFEVDAWLLLLCAVCFVLHELTVWTDLRWVQGRSTVTPIEQMVHSFQELMPLTGLVLLVSSHGSQALAIFGAGAEPAMWFPRPKTVPLPIPVLAFCLAGSIAVVMLYLEEMVRCVTARGPA